MCFLSSDCLRSISRISWTGSRFGCFRRSKWVLFSSIKVILVFFSLKQKRSSYFVLRRINFQAYGDLDKRVTVVFLNLHICKLLRLRIRGYVKLVYGFHKSLKKKGLLIFSYELNVKCTVYPFRHCVFRWMYCPHANQTKLIWIIFQKILSCPRSLVHFKENVRIF